MRCQKLRSLLPAYCSRELNNSVTSAMESHFHECRQCREDLASHRLIATTLATLANSAPNENHDKSRSSIEIPPSLINESEVYESLSMNTQSVSNDHKFTPLRVSADFNNELMERIAQERFSETRSQAHTKAFLPQNAPRFVYRRLIPALVSVTAVAALSFVSLQMGVFDTPGSDTNSFATTGERQSSMSNKLTTTAFTPDNTSYEARPLGEKLGLSEEYLTAQPINNPVYSSTASNSVAPQSLNGYSGVSSPQSASLASAQSSRPLSSSRRWHFARDYARSRRILSISNALCRRGAYFQIVQFDANGLPTGTVGNVVLQFGPSVGTHSINSPQIIVQPLPNSPSRENAPQGRMVRGSF